MDGPWHVLPWDDGYTAGYAVEREPATYPPVYFDGGEGGRAQAEELCATLNALEAAT